MIKKLIEIQANLKVPKKNVNNFGKYKYRSAEDILEAVKPLLLKYECILILTDEIIQIGQKYFLKSNAKFNYQEKELITSGFAEISEHKGMSAEQCTGTASSYARKYALNGLFLIDETEMDVDSKRNEEMEEKSKNPLQNITLEDTINLDSVLIKIKKCITINELNEIFKENPTNKVISGMLTKRKKEIENAGK